MKRRYLTLIMICFISFTIPAFAYPPDNAALVYYKCMVNFNMPEDPLGDQLRDAAKGEIKVNDQIQQYLEEKKLLIDSLQTASEVSNCDWALDFSQGLALEMPYLAAMRNFTYIMLADGQLKKQEGRLQEAMDQCLAVLRMANHVGNDTIISYLVGVAMSTLTYDAMGDILSVMPPDAVFLTDLERQLKLPEYNRLEIKTPLLNESRYLADEILRMDLKKKEILREMAVSEEAEKEITLLIEGDPEFLQLCADYYQDFFDRYIKILDLPYDEALQAFEELEDKPTEDYKAGKMEAVATTILAPAVAKIYSLDIRFRTHQNALFTAIDLYRIYAKDKSLPKELPAYVPADLFSGKPFAYEVSADGFVLRCNEKEQGDDQLWEYTFKIAK